MKNIYIITLLSLPSLYTTCYHEMHHYKEMHNYDCYHKIYDVSLLQYHSIGHVIGFIIQCITSIIKISIGLCIIILIKLKQQMLDKHTRIALAIIAILGLILSYKCSSLTVIGFNTNTINLLCDLFMSTSAVYAFVSDISHVCYDIFYNRHTQSQKFKIYKRLYMERYMSNNHIHVLYHPIHKTKKYILYR